jgi:transposase
VADRRGQGTDWFREALQEKEIRPAIPGRKCHEKAVRDDKQRYKRGTRIEFTFERLKGWRRIAIRFDRLPVVFLSAIALAADIFCR